MINLAFDTLREVLCIGAHSDDVEIGCGGTLLKLLDAHPGVRVTWVVLSGDERRGDEARRSAEAFLARAGTTDIRTASFRDSFFPHEGERLKEYFHDLARTCRPDVVFTHRREDLHQDHRTVADLTWCTFRNHLILEYEIPKYEGDLGSPNVFVPLAEDVCHRKLDTLMSVFASQTEKRWFTEDTFWSLMRLRGLECNSPTKFAEGLHCRKLVV